MLAHYQIKQLNTHSRKPRTCVSNYIVTPQIRLRSHCVFSFRALDFAKITPPPSAVATTSPLINPCSPSFPSSLIYKKQSVRIQCSSASPETDSSLEIKIEVNNYRGNSTTAQNSVEIETAKELAAREFTWFDSLRELLGHTGNDPGHWNFSPEWWGSQGGSFGRTDGQIVFSKTSKYNGLVEVTAHPASLNGFSSDISSAFGDETRQEWRVLRFNNVTRQSVARVAIVSDGGVDGSSSRLDMQQRRWLEPGQSIIAQPECVAAEYLKTIASVFGALLGLQGLFQSSGKSIGNGATTSPPATSRRRLKILCIGLGGGTLPHFIAHHFPQAHVDAAEIDPVVVEAAIEVMGLPVNDLPNLKLFTEDAFDFINARCGGGGGNSRKLINPPSISNSGVSGSTSTNTNIDDGTSILYDVVCIDAFDGDDNVPMQLCSEKFAAMLGRLLNGKHGTVLMNLHTTADVAGIGKIFYESLIGTDSTINIDNSTVNISTGCCFTVDTQKQRNVTLACCRGLDLPLNDIEAKERLRYAGVYVGHESGYRFPAGVRAERGFERLF
jgi:hypothetical protein